MLKRNGITFRRITNLSIMTLIKSTPICLSVCLSPCLSVCIKQESALTVQDRARLRSLLGKGAGARLDMVSSSHELTFEPGDFLFGMLHEIGSSSPCLTLVKIK